MWPIQKFNRTYCAGNNMKKVTLKSIARLLVCASICLSTLSVLGDVVYDNTTNKLNQVYAPGVDSSGNGIEFGDQIILGGDPALRTLNSFTFEYFLNQSSGNERITFSLYNNDGPVVPTNPSAHAPGSLIFSFGTDSIGLSGPNHDGADGSTLQYTAPPGIILPENFTWVVQFSGIDPGEVAGLELYNPPAVGNGFDDFWQKNPATGLWDLTVNTNGIPMSFGARVDAVPEASSLALGMLAGTLWLGVTVVRRKLAKA